MVSNKGYDKGISMLGALKQKYWTYKKTQARNSKLKLPENNCFHALVEQQKVDKVAIKPVSYEDNQKHLREAIDWILRAKQATNDNGVALGYFPLSEHNGWMPSYPETTGYIITTLLKVAKQNQDEQLKSQALAMADWEIDVQMPNGAVQGGPVCAPENQTAAAFNTGMVADGWMSAFEATGESKYLDAAVRAATFLANDLDEHGFFKTNGDFVSQNEVKTYTCLCAWAMYRAGMVAQDMDIKDAAIRSVEAAINQQNNVGWFKNNCLTHSDMPLTHTIGYVLQGILEVGILAERADFIAAAKLGLSGALSTLDNNGYLSARLNKQWQPKEQYVCLTGSVQLAILCYRFAEQLNNNEFIESGHKLTNFVKSTQLLSAENSAMQGAIAGSYPIMGDYMIGGYPNWATKYFIDAVMLQNKYL